MNERRFSSVGRLRDRPTLDVVVLIFTLTVAFVISASVVAVAILAFTDPGADTSGTAAVLNTHLGTIIGVLLGLIAGRASGRTESAERFETRFD